MTASPELSNDDDVAAHLAALAARALLEVRTQDLPPRELKNAGDRRAHDVIAEALSASRPKDSLLSEESKDDLTRLHASRVWIVDPLDGTREFGEVERDDWAVHIALWESGSLTIGVVALPARGITHTTRHPQPIPARPDGPLRLAVSRSRPPALVDALATKLGANVVPMGSAGVKAMAVVDGTCDAYVHAGGQYEWDSAAPVVVAAAHNLITTRLDGSPLVYNQREVYLPDLVIARPDVHDELRAALDHLS